MSPVRVQFRKRRSWKRHSRLWRKRFVEQMSFKSGVKDWRELMEGEGEDKREWRGDVCKMSWCESGGEWTEWGPFDGMKKEVDFTFKANHNEKIGWWVHQQYSMRTNRRPELTVQHLAKVDAKRGILIPLMSMLRQCDACYLWPGDSYAVTSIILLFTNDRKQYGLCNWVADCMVSLFGEYTGFEKYATINVNVNQLFI